MRTILLREWEPQPETLTTDELSALLAADKFVSVQLNPQDAGSYVVTAKSRVGTLVFDDLRVLIRPKVDLRNLFFLLGYRSGLASWSDTPFPYEQEPDLLRAMAWLFEREVAGAMPRGLVRGYVGFEEALLTVRGRIDLAGQFRRHRTEPVPLECRFEDYTEDIDINRVLKAAHVQLLRLPGVDEHVARRLRAWLRAFIDVEDREFPLGRVPEHRFTRLDRHWEAATRLAEVLLRKESLSDREGTTHGVAFTVDMNELFEKFIEEIVAERARAAHLALVPQARRRLTPSVPMRPDLVLQSAGIDLAVGDAKYKRLEIAELPNADLYQLTAYCVALGLPRGMLVYATHEQTRTEVVERAGTELVIAGVDLSLPPSALVGQAREVGDRLVAQALECRAAA